MTFLPNTRQMGLEVLDCLPVPEMRAHECAKASTLTIRLFVLSPEADVCDQNA
jgi:hypothetical protein